MGSAELQSHYDALRYEVAAELMHSPEALLALRGVASSQQLGSEFDTEVTQMLHDYHNRPHTIEVAVMAGDQGVLHAKI